jgi:23S rRNA (pseudouridine1915-N3)-methyltransferase
MSNMRLLVIAVGTRMPEWVSAAFAEYVKRMSREARIELIEVKPERRTQATNTAQVLAREAERIEALLPAGCLRVVLDEHGRVMTSPALAHALTRWRDDGRDVAFMIGGPDGLAAGIKGKAHIVLSLSAFTLPHGLARVVLAEQLYRAHTIASGHPYHRA